MKKPNITQKALIKLLSFKETKEVDQIQIDHKNDIVVDGSSNFLII